MYAVKRPCSFKALAETKNANEFKYQTSIDSNFISLNFLFKTNYHLKKGQCLCEDNKEERDETKKRNCFSNKKRKEESEISVNGTMRN